MLVAKKNYYEYDYNPYIKEKSYNTKKVEVKEIKKVKNQSKLAPKIFSVFSIGLITSCLILVLLGYTSITETKFNINIMLKEVNELEVEIQQLRLELDRLTSSDIIETKAMTELNMKYPVYEQIVFLDNTYDDFISSQEEIEEKFEEKNNDNKLVDYIFFSIEKLYSLLD